MALIRTTPVRSSWNCTRRKTASEKFSLCDSSIVLVSVVVAVICSGRLSSPLCHTLCESCASLVFSCKMSTKYYFFFPHCSWQRSSEFHVVTSSAATSMWKCGTSLVLWLRGTVHSSVTPPLR